MSRRQPFVATEPGVLGQSALPLVPEEALPDGGPMDIEGFRRAHEAEVLGSPTTGEQLSAAFSRFNTVSMLTDSLNAPSFAPDPDFDPAQHFTGEDFSQPSAVRGRFLEARSAAELEWLRVQARRLGNLDRVIQSGPLHGLVAGLIASIVDPINLLPLGWVAAPVRLAKVTTRAGRLLSGVSQGALVGAAATMTVEPFARGADPFRTLEDTLTDLLIGGAIGAGLGGLIGGLRQGPVDPLTREMRNQAADAEDVRVGAPPGTARAVVGEVQQALAEAQIKIEAPDRVPSAATEPLSRATDRLSTDAGGSVGAAAVDDMDTLVRSIRPALNKVLGDATLRAVTRGVAAGTFDALRYPGMQLATSRFDGVRDFMASMADTGLHTRVMREMTEDQMEAAMRLAEERGYGYGSAEQRARTKAMFMQMSREGTLTVTDYAPLLSRIQMLENVAGLQIDDMFATARAELRQAGVKVGKDELDEMLAVYAQYTANPQQFGDVPPASIPAAAEPVLAKAVADAREMMRVPFSEAQRFGVVPEDITSRDMAYWPFMLDREAILGDHQGFRQALFEDFKEQQQRARDVVEPYERAVANWKEQGRINNAAIRAAREARKTGQDPTELYRSWYQQARVLRRYNGQFRRIAAKMKRDFGEELAPGQTLDDWVDQQAARGPQLDAEHQAFYRQKIEEYPEVRAEEERIAAAKGREPNPEIVDVTPEEWAANQVEAQFKRDLGEGVRLAEYIEARTELYRANVAYEAFRNRNNAEWRAMTRPFVEEADEARFPGGYDMPAFRPPRPLAPKNYERNRRLIRSTDNIGEPARLADDVSIWREVDAMFVALTGGEDPYRFGQTGMRGHLKQRGLEVNWSRLQPYTVRSFNQMLHRYMTMVGRDVETVRTYGTWDANEIVTKLGREPRIKAERLTDAAKKALREAQESGDQTRVAEAQKGVEKAEADAEAIMRDFQRDQEVVQALIAQARGTFIPPPKTVREAKFRAALQTGQTLMYVTRMGSALLAQIGELTRATLIFGLVRFAGPLIRSLGQSLAELARAKDPGTLRLMRTLGTMSEGAILSHNRILHDVAPNPMQGPVGRTLNRISPIFSKSTLMPLFNDVMRRAALNLTQDDFVKTVMGDARTSSARMLWAHSGITPSEREILRGLVNRHARNDWAGNLDLHIEEWAAAHPDLAHKVRSALHLATQRVLITPSAADAPLWTQTVYGRPITQFKRFIFASVPQLLIPTLQSPGLRMLEVALAAVIFGTLSTISRDLITKGEIKDRNALGWVIAALDMSGLTSMITEVDATLGKLSPYLSARLQLTGELPDRYFERTLWGQVLGPTAGAVETGLRRTLMIPIAGVSSSLNMDPRYIAAARSFMPFQNHLVLRHILDVLEARIGGRVTGPFGEMGAP